MNPAPGKKVYWFILVSWLLAGGFLIFARHAGAQTPGANLNLGIQPFLPLTGLGNPDIREVIAGIIKIFLSLLGIIALVIMLYGGFLYMTAGGDVEKVTRAKKLIAQAVIGLIIILSAYGITSFVLRQLEVATGIGTTGGGGPGGGGGAGGLPPDAFVVKGIAPQGKINIRNVVVRITFSRNVDQASVQQNVTIKKQADLSDVAGKFTVVDRSVEFVPDADCPAPNNDRKCFDSDTQFVVDISTSLTSLDGKSLICGLGGSSCRAVFITGNLIDVEPPKVNITNPIDGQSVSADAQVLLESTSTDDGGISQIKYKVDDQTVDVDTPTSDVSPLSYKSTGNWDTTGVTPGTTHTLTAVVSDIDSNETTSAAVGVVVRAAHCFNAVQDADESAIDCGGKECGACTGGACSKNSDCADGVCIGGKCLELPQITDLNPADGAPGNLITLKGINFGTSEGKVEFLGNVNDPNDDVTAALASCKDSWLDTQVIIEVPQGAASGPLKITSAAGLYDQTNDSRGFKGDFEINTITRPGICQITPAEGETGIETAIDGKGFGTNKDTVLFGGVKSSDIVQWSPEKITGIVVPTVNDGSVDVVVGVNNEKSNAVQFQVDKSLDQPVINTVNPVSGAAGEYITISGSNFGADTGTVKFLNVTTGVETLADTTFPTDCGTNYWHDAYIIVKVPGADVGSYKIKVIRDNKKESNSVDFTINHAPLTPGICFVDPDNGPAATTVNIYGERFGTAQGKVRFFDRQEDGNISGWTDESVKVDVPTAAKTGPMELIDVAGTLSNSVNFTIGSCTVNSCAAGDECCTNGSCQEKGSCPTVAPECTYSWLFSTGPLGSDAPTVVDDPSCRDGNPQSPTPYHDTTDACINAQMSARFDRNMREATLDTKNIFYVKCGTNGDFNSADCGADPLPATIQIISRDTSEEGFLLKPTNQFDADTWYQVTIKNDVQSDEGVNMVDDYVWHFKTAADGSLCHVDFVQVVPEKDTIVELNGTQEYTGLPTAANCNILDPDSYSWRWASSDPTRATVGNDTDSTTIATALAETEPQQPVHIAGAIPSESKDGFGELTIDFANPQVIQVWPDCDTACINAKIGARFSQNMNKDTFTNATVKIFSCDDAACDTKLTPIALDSIVYDPVNFDVLVTPSGGLLAPNQPYRGIIYGGDKGVKGISNTTLVGLNFNSTGQGDDDSYSWIFQTQDSKEVCAVDRVEVNPTNLDVYLIGLDSNYSSDAFSAPDKCSADGEALNPFFYDWAWLSTQTDVATVTDQNILPANKVDAFIDPLQVATSQGQGTTTIQAGTETKAGEGQLNVICGFSKDGECPAPATLQTYGVGSDTCCWPRPKVVATNPMDGATDVCRNALIEADFNAYLSQPSVNANTYILEGNYGSSPCPDIAGVTSVPEQQPDGSVVNWCRWPGTPYLEVTGTHNSSAMFEVTSFMEPNRTYRVRLVGDKNLSDDQKDGIQNDVGVAMNGDYTFTFSVGTDICKVEAVDIAVMPPGTPIQKDLFTCAGRDDCPNDQLPPDSQNPGAPGNQHVYFARARDHRGFLLPATYSWQVSGDDVISEFPDQGQLGFVTSKATNGEALVTVNAVAKPPTEGNAANSQDVEVFICDNPWPAIDTFPYSDNSGNPLACQPGQTCPYTNYSLLYCRDAGDPGLDGDLPSLQPSTAKPGTGDLIKQFLFTIK